MSSVASFRLPFVLSGGSEPERAAVQPRVTGPFEVAATTVTTSLVESLRAEVAELWKVSQLLRDTVSRPDLDRTGRSTDRGVDDAAEPGAILRLNLLGQFELFANGHALHVALQRRARELIAFVALGSNRTRARDELLEVFWSQLPIRKASNNLSVVLHEVRSRLAHAHAGGTVGLIGERGSYEFGPGASVVVDVERFRSRIEAARGAIRNGDVERARTWLLEATSMYRGDLLALDQYTAWLEGPRRILAQQFEWALLWLADDAASEGDWQRVLALGLTLIERDQEGEDGHRLAINAYLRLGRRERALRQYRAYAAARGLPDLTDARVEALDLRDLFGEDSW